MEQPTDLPEWIATALLIRRICADYKLYVDARDPGSMDNAFKCNIALEEHLFAECSDNILSLAESLAEDNVDTSIINNSILPMASSFKKDWMKANNKNADTA